MLYRHQWKGLFATFFPPSLSGIFLFLSFPDFEFFPLAFIGFIPLFFSIRNKSPKQAFFLGWYAGTVFFLGTLYWVIHTMVIYGKIPLVLSFVLMMLLVAYLATYFAVFSSLVCLLRMRYGFSLVFTAPFVWVSLEYLRTYLFSGFPWVLLGYSQYQFLPFIQIAELTGVYGVSFLIVGINALIFDWASIFILNGKRQGHFPSLPWKPTLAALLFLFPVFLFGWFCQNLYKKENFPSAIRVALVQGNIDQAKKWDRRFQEETLSTYLTLSREVSESSPLSPDLIIWPEAATPFILNQDLEYQKQIRSLAQSLSIPILLGSPSLSLSGRGNPVLSNSAYLVSGNGRITHRYDKIHLVPFGEYVPLSSLLFFVNKMVQGIGDFKPGEEYTVMDTAQTRFGTVICFEVIFPDLVRKFVDRGANFMVTITNDAWFGTTSAPFQHFAMSVFRAVENRVPLARAANTGISGFIDPQGRILAKSGLFEETTLGGSLWLPFHTTFYTKYGDIFAWGCGIITLFYMIGIFIFNNRKKGMNHVGRTPRKI